MISYLLYTTFFIKMLNNFALIKIWDKKNIFSCLTKYPLSSQKLLLYLTQKDSGVLNLLWFIVIRNISENDYIKNSNDTTITKIHHVS